MADAITFSFDQACAVACVSCTFVNVLLLTVLQCGCFVRCHRAQRDHAAPAAKDTLYLSWWKFVALCACICAGLVLGCKILAFTGSLPAAVFSLSLDWHPIYRGCLHKGRFVWTVAVIRCIAFAAGIGLAQIWDFRLNNTSRNASVGFVLVSGLSKILLAPSGSASYVQGGASQSSSYTISASHWPAFVLFPLGVAAYSDEWPQVLEWSLTKQMAMLLVVSLVSTTAACVSGGFLFRPFPNRPSEWTMVHDPHEAANESRARRVIVAAFIASVTIASPWLINTASILSPWQCVGLGVSFLATSECGQVDTSLQTDGFRESSSSLDRTDGWISVNTEASSKLLPTNPVDLEASSITRAPSKNFHWLNELPVPAVLVILGIAVTYATLGVSPPQAGDERTRLDIDYQAIEDLDIVVAANERSSEDLAGDIESILHLPSIEALHPRVFLYDKGPGEWKLEEGMPQTLRNQTQRFHTASLDNTGREGDTYLRHITNHWDSLARHTLFVQEEPHDFALLQSRLSDYLAPSTGFMSLSYAGVVLPDCDRPHDRSWLQDPVVIRGLHRATMPGRKCENLVLTYRGQFVVSAARIRGNDKSFYQGMLHDLQDPESWMHSRDFTENRWNKAIHDSLESPVFGYTLERMWGVIMQCSNTRLAFWSPSLLATHVRSILFRQRFPLEDVQCVDRPDGGSQLSTANRIGRASD